MTIAEGFQRLLGSTVEHRLHQYCHRLARIEGFEAAATAASDARLTEWSTLLRERMACDPAASGVTDELFAVVREAASRVLGERPYDEQIIAGLVLTEGAVAEMQTGEGKTLSAVAPVALSAFEGRGVHVLTVNDYLARRDAAWMGPLYNFLGLSVGFVQEGMSIADRQAAYGRDVTYLTAKEAGFDYLRDCLCLDPHDVVHRPFHFALVDEADSILIDEARIPLVIAGPVEDSESGLESMAEIARRFEPATQFDFAENRRNVYLTDAGVQRAEQLLGCGGLFDMDNIRELTNLQNALHAHYLLTRDVDYIVRDGSIELVDDFTGRVADRRQWPDGLQGAIEAKEGVEVRREGMVLGSITVQHFLASYPRLAGMTATAVPAAEELHSTYELSVVVIPPHRRCRRIDHDDRIFSHREAKESSLVEEISRVHRQGRPVLVGTASVAESEALSSRLEAAAVPCQVLNAKQDQREAEVIAEAGAVGAVTISTNMAGRGTDIRLGGRRQTECDRVVELGGLYVIGTNRHESLRVDRQLRGRAGRQGDPGSSRFFISFEDPLIERYGIAELLPARQRQVRRRDPISSPVVRRTIATGQRIVEGESFAIRRRLWRYSELMDRQRSWMQTRRRSLLRGDKKPGLLRRRCPEPWAAALEKVGEDGLSEIERRITLLMIDRCWSDYLALMTSVRDGIHVVGLVGKDPLAEFYRETGEAFEDLQVRVEEAVVETFGRVMITDRGVDWEKEGLLGPSSTGTYLVNDTPFGANPLRSLANRPGLALFGVLVLGPLLFLWGIREHWRKRRGRKCR